MTKRKRFVITSVLLSLGFVGVQVFPEQNRFISIGLLSLATILLFSWSLREGLNRDLTLSTLILPFFFTVGVGLFWFLLPTSVYARIPIVILYGIGIYALCLTMNIYTVAAIRTIALLRAARGVGFVLTLLTFFLVFDAILSLKAPIWAMSSAVFLVSLPLYFQALWTIPLSKTLGRNILKMSLAFSLVMGEVAISLFFWPVTVVVGSLFLTVAAYMLLGLGQAQLEGKLFKQTVREYLTVGILVFFGMLLATRWGG